MKQSKFTAYPEDVLKILLEVLIKNMSRANYDVEQFDELYINQFDDLGDALRISASQIGDTNLEYIDYDFLLNLWGLNPNYTEGDTLNIPKLRKFVVTTRVDVERREQVREFWDTRYVTYSTESHLRNQLEDYENPYWEGELTSEDVRDSDTANSDSDIYDINEEPLTESKYKTKVIEEFDNKMNDISYLKKMKTIIENRIDFLSRK